MTDYITVHNLKKYITENKRNLYTKVIIDVMVIFIKLTLLGYHHLDFHLGNVMINLKTNDIKIIDFGLTQRLNKLEYNEYERLIDSKKYTKVLELLFDFGRVEHRKYDIKMFPKLYKYITGKYNYLKERNVPIMEDNKINEQINEIISEEQIDISNIKKNTLKMLNVKKTQKFRPLLHTILNSNELINRPMKNTDLEKRISKTQEGNSILTSRTKVNPRLSKTNHPLWKR